MITKINVYLAVCTFLIGFLASTAIFNDDIRYASSDNGNSLDSPSDRISDADLFVYPERTIIEKQGLIWAKIKNTHSMEPVLNSNAISLELPPVAPTDISIGDIISFKQGSMVLIHRIVSISSDSDGWYVVTKGDNNQEPDPYKVRFDQIKGVLVGVLY